MWVGVAADTATDGSREREDGMLRAQSLDGPSNWLVPFIKVYILVGGLEHEFICPYIGNFIIPTDEVIFFRGVG